MNSGKILRVNLTDGSVTTEASAKYSERFLGGRGINAMLLFEQGRAGINPLDPANPLIFGVGTLCGMPSPAGDVAPFLRMEVTSKSPETGLLGTSNLGGAFGLDLRRSGYTNLVITGKSEKPVYLWINNDTVEIRAADWLWGKDTYVTQDLIKTEVDADATVACIGPAGENLVRFASIRHKEGHSASRTGMGCVMGSKNLKAVVAKGTLDIEFPDTQGCKDVVEKTYAELDKRWWTQEIKKHGMVRLVDDYNILWYSGDEESAPRVADLHVKYEPKQYGCRGCKLKCMEYYPAREVGGYGTVAQCAFYIWPSFMVRNRDPEVLLETIDIAQRQGIDIISSMGIVGWLMEIAERGLITPEQTDGIVVEWGSEEAIIGLLNKMIFREGIGDLLADGMGVAAKKLGGESEFHAIHVKGLPIYGISNPDVVIGDKDITLSLVVSSRGDTMKAHFPGETVANLKRTLSEEGSEAYAKAIYQNLDDLEVTTKVFETKEYEGKPERTIFGEDMITINDMVGFCKLQSWHFGSEDNLKYQAKLVSEAVGKHVTQDDLIHYARRVKHIERVINIREGNTSKTDILPERLVDQEVKTEGRKFGQIVDREKFEGMKTKYYYLRGWDTETGIPTRQTLESFGLNDIADAFEAGQD